MDDIPLLDMSTATTTDKLCFMILDHLRRAEDEFNQFRNEYIESKRIEKYNQVMAHVEKFIDREDDDKYHIMHEGYDPSTTMVFWKNEEEHQLAISITISKLSPERIRGIWNKLFPTSDIDTLLQRRTYQMGAFVYKNYFTS